MPLMNFFYGFFFCWTEKIIWERSIWLHWIKCMAHLITIKKTREMNGCLGILDTRMKWKQPYFEWVRPRPHQKYLFPKSSQPKQYKTFISIQFSNCQTVKSLSLAVGFFLSLSDSHHGYFLQKKIHGYLAYFREWL